MTFINYTCWKGDLKTACIHTSQMQKNYNNYKMNKKFNCFVINSVSTEIKFHRR